MKVNQKPARRNGDIIKSFKREINLNTRVVKSKKEYTRKVKHKAAQAWLDAWASINLS